MPLLIIYVHHSILKSKYASGYFSLFTVSKMKEIKILKKTQVNLKDSTDPLGSSVCDLEGYKGGATSWHVASPVAKGWVPALLPR